jgi:hypothetical protein
MTMYDLVWHRFGRLDSGALGRRLFRWVKAGPSRSGWYIPFQGARRHGIRRKRAWRCCSFWTTTTTLYTVVSGWKH